jgi:hypothetical protein
MMLRAFLDFLITDETSRRALEETLADWRDERRHARTSTAFAAASIRGFVATIRAMAMIVASGFRAPELWYLVAGTAMSAFAVSAAFVGIAAGTKGFPYTATELVSLVPLSMVLFMAVLAAFAAGLQARRRVSLLPAALLLLLLGVVLDGFIVPTSNQVFRDSVFARVNGGGSRSAPPPGIAESTLVDLRQQIVSRDARRSAMAMNAFSSRLAAASLIAVCFLLGAAFRMRVFPAFHWAAPWLSGLASLLLLYISALAGALTMFPVTASTGSGAIWFANAVGVLAIVFLTFRREPRSRPGLSGPADTAGLKPRPTRTANPEPRT